MAIPGSSVIPALERYAARPLWITVPGALLRFMRRKPTGAVGALLVLLMVFAALFAPVLSPYDPLDVHPPQRLSPPGSSFLLGSDDLGRDILSRTIYGARTSITIGVLAVLLGTTTGTLVGVLSAYLGGKFDLLVQRLVDGIFAFPLLVFALVIVAVLGQSIGNVIGALAIVLVPSVSRVIRGSALSIMEQQYIEAARAMGARHFRIAALYVIPNVLPVVIILASIQLGTAIIVEASLSFLGLGTPPPTPSWGGMLSGSGRRFLEVAPWLALVPGAAISLAVLGVNLLGDALRDVLDPRLRGT